MPTHFVVPALTRRCAPLSPGGRGTRSSTLSRWATGPTKGELPSAINTSRRDKVNRRDVIKGALGAFTMWTSSRVLNAQQASGGVRRLTDKMVVVDGGGSNVLAWST